MKKKDWELYKKAKKKNQLLKKQEKLMEILIRQQNEQLMSKRGWIGIYDKNGNLTCKD